MYKEIETLVLDISFEDDEIQQLKTDQGFGRALLYKRMTRAARVGECVIVNTTATELHLGTGGWDIVRYVKVHPKIKRFAIGDATGHIMKARYTPVQHSVLTVEAEESAHHELFKQKFSLKRQPVLLAELHSMVPLIYYLAQEIKKNSHCCIIFDDQAALPLMMSDQLRELHKEKNFTSITVGQAFGGQYEAVNIATALQFAKTVIKSDVIVISVGPGVVGTGTYYGFGGMAVAHWSHIVSGLGGRPVWIPRLSFTEKRSRHYGISHHTLTPLSEFTFKQAVLPLPFMNENQREVISKQIENASFQIAHDIRYAKVDVVSNNVELALKKATNPIQSMGRKYEDDPMFFLAVAEALRVGIEGE